MYGLDHMLSLIKNIIRLECVYCDKEFMINHRLSKHHFKNKFCHQCIENFSIDQGDKKQIEHTVQELYERLGLDNKGNFK